jgi:hypothetical protein
LKDKAEEIAHDAKDAASQAEKLKDMAVEAAQDAKSAELKVKSLQS